MHHFLGSAGRSGSRSTCRRPIRPQRRGVPRRRSKGSRGVKHHARSAGGSTTQAVPHTHPRPKAHPVPSRPRPPAGGYLSRRQPRPWAGGRKVRTSGAGMVSNPSAAGGPSRPAHPSGPAGRSAHPTLETWCPATKEQGFAGSEAPRPTCRRPTYAPHPARLQLQGR